MTTIFAHHDTEIGGSILKEQKMPENIYYIVKEDVE